VAVTTDDRAVVWVESTMVWLCPVTGCTSGTGVSAGGVGAFSKPVVGGVAMDATFAYWMADTGYTVLKCPLAGCLNANSVFFTPSGPGINQIAANSMGVFMTNGAGTVGECPSSGCTSMSTFTTTIIYRPDATVTPFALDSGGVFYGLNGEASGTFYCAFGHCPASLSTPLTATIGSLAAANGVGYIWKGSTISSCPGTGCSTIPTVLTTAAGQISSLAADSTAVYWTVTGATASTGSVQMCSLPSCAGGPVVLAPNQTNPVSISVSAHYVVWANQGASGTSGAIMGWVK
jgi:hypothetical protein